MWSFDTTTKMWISLVTAQSQSLARNALRPRGVRWCSPIAPIRLLPAPGNRGSANPNDVVFGAQSLQSRHRPLLLFLARFRCLRINHPVTETAARLDTAPMASGCAGGTSTHWITRHCKAATFPLPHLAFLAELKITCKIPNKMLKLGAQRSVQIVP